jgi:Xaa-Pro aminopeptidase
MLTLEGAKKRRDRLLQIVQRRQLDAVAIGNPRHVYYFSAFLPHWLHSAGFILFADGSAALVAPEGKVTASDPSVEIIPFAPSKLASLRPDQSQEVATKIHEQLSKLHAKSIAVDSAAATAHLLLQSNLKATSIEPDLYQLRRRKDPDELQLIRNAADCCHAMYKTAKEILAPGILETEMFAEMQKAAVLAAAEPLSDILGNDFVCGGGGGPPREGRAAQAGELYVLDVGPAYRGYFADACRTFSVDRKPTDAQISAWNTVMEARKIAEQLAKPGARCVDIFNAVDDFLKSKIGRGLSHHLGHGVGLQPHEHPFLNPNWDDVLMEGEVLTLEPGLYSRQELRGGIRLENQYLVTATGLESLLDFPLELV